MMSMRKYRASKITLSVMDLEVSNRSVTGMRRDYLTYFADPMLFCVLGIKLFGSGKPLVHYNSQCCMRESHIV